jgi:5'-deoxynucleotidase YfbR-like HD superfamily hydrolase
VSNPWLQTSSGIALDLLNPQPAQICLGDIARQLSRLPRFNGATSGPVAFSVAQHSCLVMELVAHYTRASPDPMLLLAALLHDAHEAYVGDMPTPVKDALAHLGNGFIVGWCMLVDRIQCAVHQSVALSSQLPGEWEHLIRAADLQALTLERDAFMLPLAKPWPDMPKPPQGFDMPLAPCAPHLAERHFIAAVQDCFLRRHNIGATMEAA